MQRMKYQFKNKEQLILELNKLNKIIASLKKEKMKWQKIENELNVQKNELTERVKELNCLYNISKIIGQKKLSLDNTMQKIIDIILSAWQYQDYLCARITLNNREFKLSNFQKISRSL